MRRTLVMLAVTALLVLALAVPAFAFTSGDQPPGPPTVSGAQGVAGAAAVHCNSEELGGQGTVVTVEQNNSTHGGGNCSLPV
jgi:putative hemolysin